MKEKEEDEENKIRKFAYREQTIKQRTKSEFKHWGHSNPLWIVGGAGQLIQKYSKRKKNKEKFLEIEEDWLQRQEVNL